MLKQENKSKKSWYQRHKADILAGTLLVAGYYFLSYYLINLCNLSCHSVTPAYKKQVMQQVEQFDTEIKKRKNSCKNCDVNLEVLVTVDPEFAAYYDDTLVPWDSNQWKSEITSAFDHVNKKFNEFGINFNIKKVGYWEAFDPVYSSMSNTLGESYLYHLTNSYRDVKSYDIVLGLAKGKLLDTSAGAIEANNYFCAVSVRFPDRLKHLVQHELSHLFGVGDSKPGGAYFAEWSVMDNGTRLFTSRWTDEEKEIIKANKYKFKY